jgi:hypothetical protein
MADSNRHPVVQERDVSIMETPIQMETEGATENPAAANSDHDVIQALAHAYWIARGCPIGSPEVDWLRAEEDLKNQRASQAAV